MLRIRVIELVPHLIIPPSILLVEPHDIDHGLRVFLLLLLGDSTLLQQTLPFFRQTGELARLVVIADMSNMDGILGGGDLDATGRT
jgi:hypothetical protein